MDIAKVFEPMMIDMYLPEHIRSTFYALGLSSKEIEEKVKEIMGDPVKKQQFLDFVMSKKDDEEAPE
jgi:hypothetical protein